MLHRFIIVFFLLANSVLAQETKKSVELSLNELNDFTLLANSVPANETASKRYVHKGLFRFQGNIAAGVMPKQGITNIYLGGNSEFYMADNISVRGDLFVFMGSMNGKKLFKRNESVFAGLSYHFKTNSHLDPYVGLQHGLAYSQAFPTGSLATYNPLFSGLAGINFYANRFFHLFLESRYVYGNHLSPTDIQPLNEIRFAFGLGFNFN